MEFFKVLLIGHILGDFYFQSDKMANNKSEYKTLIFHSFLYGLFVSLSVIFYKKINLIIIVIVLIIFMFSHMLIDGLKTIINKVCENNNLFTFTVDQIAHIFVLIIVLINLQKLNNSKIVNIYYLDHIVSLVLVILLLCKPTSIFIKTSIEKFKPTNSLNTDLDSAFTGIDNAGKWIGILERMLILVMLFIGSISSIGLVITAKSIVRYTRLTEDRRFSEYYLLGTLLSTLIVIVVYTIFYNSDVFYLK